MSSVLKIENVEKSYGRRQVVQSVSFLVDSGRVVGLLGPNGAGKTTTFYMVVGLLKAQAGDIQLNGQSIVGLPMSSRAKIGLSYLPQEACIFRRLTVQDNLLIALEAHEYRGARKREKLQQLLQDFGLEEVKDSMGYSLSGGERRRAEIARSLAGSPDFLLLDEPFTGIDPIAVHDIQNIIRQLSQQGIGILLNDHNVRETLRICDYAYILKDGKIQAEGTAQQITDNPMARKYYLGEDFQL